MLTAYTNVLGGPKNIFFFKFLSAPVCKKWPGQTVKIDSWILYGIGPGKFYDDGTQHAWHLTYKIEFILFLG